MKKLLHSWCAAQIGLLCSLKNGRAFKPSEWTTNGLPIIRIQNLNNPKASFNYFDGEFSDRYYLQGGELLFAWSGTPGTSFGAHVWKGGEAVLNQHIFRVDFCETMINKNFFRYAINQKLNELIDIAHGGVGLRHVTKGKFESTEIAFAPLNEQKRIADKLDSILARVDACRERLDRIPAILKRFRQAVLAAATSGKLTEEWRSTNCVTKTWTKVKFTDVGELNRGKSKHRPRNDLRLFEGIYPFIQTGDIAQSDGKITTHHQTYSEFGLSQSKLWPSGTVCITIAANIADTAILTYPVCFPDSVVGFVADPEKCIPEFIKWSVDVISEHIESFAPSTAQKNINLGILNEIYFLCPPIEEQTEIVRRVEELFACAERIEARYQIARARIDKLTPAILAKAFRGELVPQDHNDEPASVLLERIRASRAEHAVTPKSKRSRTIASRKTPDIE